MTMNVFRRLVFIQRALEIKISLSHALPKTLYSIFPPSFLSHSAIFFNKSGSRWIAMT